MSEETLVFKRHWITIVANDVVIYGVNIVLSVLLIYGLFFYHLSDAYTARIFAAIGLGFCGPVLFLGRIYLGDIHVDDNGIGWWWWGRRWRYIPWSNIKGVTITTIATPTQMPKSVSSYCLFTTESQSWYNAQRHGMRFDSSIQNSTALIDVVNLHIRQHNIPVADKRKKTTA